MSGKNIRLKGNLGTTASVSSVTATIRQLLAQRPDADRSTYSAPLGGFGKIGFPLRHLNAIETPIAKTTQANAAGKYQMGVEI